MTTLDHLASILLQRLAWTSLQAVLLVAVVALLIRALPRLPASARCALWWLVGAQVLLGLCWQAPIRLPLLTPATVAEAPVVATRISVGSDAPIPGNHSMRSMRSVRSTAPQAAMPATHGTNADTTPGWLSLHWRTALVAAWLLLLLAQLPALIREYRNARRLRRDTLATTDADLLARCTQQSRMLGLRRAPAMLASPDIASPQVSGGWRAVLLWPAHHALSEDEAALALAHELAHLKRGDLLFGWIPALASRLFFFHPLLRWAMREYALHREAACDALAVEQQRAAPQDYGRLLLRLGVAHPLHAALGGASPTFHNLKRRLTMLQQTTTAMPHGRGWLLVAIVALVGVLPYRVVAGDHATSAATPSAANPTSLPPAPPAPPAPPVPPAALPGPPPTPPPAPPSPPALPISYTTHHMTISMHGDDGHDFVLVDGNSMIINGSSRDAKAAQKLRKQGEPLLWFRHDGQGWAIRDRNFIQRAEALYAPVNALARQQSKLGEQQSALGGQQGTLGSRQGTLGDQQGQNSSRIAELAMQQADINERIAELDSQSADSIRCTHAAPCAFGPGAEQHSQSAASNDASSTADERKALATRSARITAELDAIEARQATLEKQQAALGEQQDALGKQQETLGERQQMLGDQQNEASAKASEQMDQLLADALAKGMAQPATGH